MYYNGRAHGWMDSSLLQGCRVWSVQHTYSLTAHVYGVPYGEVPYEVQSIYGNIEWIQCDRCWLAMFFFLSLSRSLPPRGETKPSARASS